jgi:hypothetical protein
MNDPRCDLNRAKLYFSSLHNNTASWPGKWSDAAVVANSGSLAALPLMVTFYLAMHNSPITQLVLGVPFDRALPWHKVFALSATLQGDRKLNAESHRGYHILPFERNTLGMEISG